MAQGTLKSQKPRGLLRWFLRMPIWFYRHKMGWMMGNRYLMIEHTGRRSGLKRYVVVEVVHHNRESNVYTVASGWGKQSDWFKNIRITPEVKLVTAKGEIQATAVFLPAEEAARFLKGYAREHPAAFHSLSKMMVGPDVDPGDVEKIALLTPVVSFIPR